jgi:hypothetical protein
VRPGLDTGERQGYATALAGLWSGLSQTLTRLEELAADPDESLADDDRLAQLPGLQYALHAASEAAAGIAPPVDSEATHAELAAALADARDSTAEVADAAAAGGPDAAWPLVYEWRGALFRVRLARLRLAPRATAAPRRTVEPVGPSLGAIVLVALGAIAIVAGALLALWPIAAAGLTLSATMLLRGRP